MLFNPGEVVIKKFSKKLKEGYLSLYGGMKKDYAEIIEWAARITLESWF